MPAELNTLDAFEGNFDEVEQKLHHLSRLTGTIVHSQIIVTLAAAQRFPAGFDDQDIAVLQWIAAEGHHAKRRRLC